MRRGHQGPRRMSRRSLLRGMLAFSGGTFVSRVLGLVREVVIAAVFGATAATDAFLVAFRIPNFMRRLFAERLVLDGLRAGARAVPADAQPCRTAQRSRARPERSARCCWW